MVGWSEFHRMGPLFLKTREVLLEIRENFGNEEKVILYVFNYIRYVTRGERIYRFMDYRENT